MKRIVVFASGSGSNFQAILDACASGRISGNVVGLVAGKAGIGAIEKAKSAGVPHRILNPIGSSVDVETDSTLLQKWLTEWNPDLIALAGFLRKVPDSVLESWEGRILNIHPSLLPKFGGKGFYGLNVHQAVLDAGEQTTGCTVHIVNADYDEGEILARSEISVAPSVDAAHLAARVLQLEHDLYPKVIEQQLTKFDS